MKNKIIIILGLALFLNVKLFSQAIGFEGKRFSVDLSIGESVLNKYYQLVYDGIDSEDMIYTSLYMPAFRFNSSVNYTLSRKSSIGLIFSGSRKTFEPLDISFLGSGNLEFSVGKVDYFGVGLKYSRFSSGFISPVGSSMGYYVKYNTVSSKEYTYIDEDFDAETYENKTTFLKMNFITLGVFWDNMSFLSEAYPIYLKYGVSVGFRVYKSYSVGKESIKYSVSDFESSTYTSETHYVGNQQFSSYYNLFEAVELHLGIGYIFGK